MINTNSINYKCKFVRYYSVCSKTTEYIKIDYNIKREEEKRMIRQINLMLNDEKCNCIICNSDTSNEYM